LSETTPNTKALHWAQQMALDIKTRVEKDPFLKQLVEEKGLLVYDEKTPSGTIHIGSGRGWVIHDVVAKCLRELGLKARFVLSADDFDPYDKPNKDLDPKVFNPYLGMPFCDIPSPVEGYASFGDYFFRQSTEHFGALGIECGFESTAENYRKGIFNEQIRTILDNVEKVQQIYITLYGEDSPAAKKMPFNVRCTQCGKIATTLASKWDSEKGLLYYECRSDVVDWAQGCGYSGWSSPFDGGGKFPWKVEWAAKWPGRGVVVEFGGKDHFSKGGSRTCANMIAVDVLNYPPPYPSHGYNTGPGYEFFQIGGAKMSTSKGKGMSFAEGVEFFPGEMLRFLLLKSRPNSVVDFDPETNDILLLCDQYDRMERIHFGLDPAKDDNDKAVQSALYQLVHVAGRPEGQAPQVPLNLASTMFQITLSKEGAFEKLVELGHIPKGLDQKAKALVMRRIDLAQRWVNRFASEQFLFRLVSEEAPCTDLSDEERAVLTAFVKFLGELPSGLSDSKELHNGIYEFAREKDLDTKIVFAAAYHALINRPRGPQLASFIMTVGIDKTRRLLQAGINFRPS